MPNTDDCIIAKFMDLPCKVKSFVIPNEDDTYTIIVNSKLCVEQQKSAYVHELKHIFRNDFSKHNIQEIEYSTHSKKTYELNKQTF